MNSHPVEITKVGQHWIAHRPSQPRHDCALDDSPHGTADTEVGALRRLLRAEGA